MTVNQLLQRSLLTTVLLALALVLAVITTTSAADSFPVAIRVDAGKPLGELKPIWRFFGADEPNYAYMKHGQKLLAELGELLGVRGEPGLLQIQRWRHTMPQYELGHLERVARIRRMLADCGGLALAGNAYGGAGIAHCIHSGEQAAEEVAEQLHSERSCLAARSDG